MKDITHVGFAGCGKKSELCDVVGFCVVKQYLTDYFFGHLVSRC